MLSLHKPNHQAIYSQPTSATGLSIIYLVVSLPSPEAPQMPGALRCKLHQFEVHRFYEHACGCARNIIIM